MVATAEGLDQRLFTAADVVLRAFPGSWSAVREFAEEFESDPAIRALVVTASTGGVDLSSSPVGCEGGREAGALTSGDGGEVGQGAAAPPVRELLLVRCVELLWSWPTSLSEDGDVLQALGGDGGGNGGSVGKGGAEEERLRLAVKYRMSKKVVLQRAISSLMQMAQA